MKAYTKTYFDYFGIGYYPDGSHDYIECEMPNCGNEAVDVAHVIPKSRGGKDVIENLAALCRKHHEETEGHTEPLLSIHLNNLKQ